MKKVSRLLVFIFLLSPGLMILPSRRVQADAGPHPTMQFTFISEIKPVPAIQSGQLLECNDAACTKPAPLGELGPQRFECLDTACNSMAYSYSPYHRLQIKFSDGATRLSNSFTKQAFAANYVVYIYENDLTVEEKFLGPNVPFLRAGAPTLWSLLTTLAFPLLEIILPIILVGLALRTGRAGASLADYVHWQEAAWLLAVPAILAGIGWTKGLIITLLVELLVGKVYVLWRKRSAGVLLTVILLLNLITQPILWVTVSGFSGLTPAFVILLAEMVVWLAEAGGLYLSQRSSMRWQEAVWVSFALNAASFVAGSLLPL